MKPVLIDAWRRVRNVLRWTAYRRIIPNRCVLCELPTQGGHQAICHYCLEELPYLNHACPVCAEPLPYAALTPCGRCQKRPPSFVRVWAAVHYGPPTDQLITGLKFANKRELAWALAYVFSQQLDAQCRSAQSSDTVLIPMPLHPNRLRQRGYNQAELIADALADHYGLKVRKDLCRRSLDTQPQVGMDRRQRRRNVRRAFHCRGDLTGKRAIIVDDVVTTGASVDALAAVLQKAGACRVEVWAIARAGLS